MGIPFFFSHVVKKHENIFENIKKHHVRIDNLYMDCNSVIYDCINNDNTMEESELFKFISEKIIHYISLIKPSNNIMIAFDGIPPLAKMCQQRKRRYKSYYESLINSEINNTIENDVKFDTIQITPGTSFMNRLNTYIYSRFKNPEEFKVSNIIVSCSNECGEGEHKIFDYIRENKDLHENTSTVIYGLDADLIMLSLLHDNLCNKLYLYRDTPYYINNINVNLNPKDNYIMNINNLKYRICNDIFEVDDNYDRIINDYVFMCFFLGNDFLPHTPSLNIRTIGINTLLDIYEKHFIKKAKYIINNDSIEWKNLYKFINILSDLEEQLIKKEYKIRKNQEKYCKSQSHTLNNIPLLDRTIEENINPFQIGWEERYYSRLLDISNNLNKVKKLSINYLEGLEWTYKYYKSGNINYEWKYNYNYPPLFKDLIKYTPYFNVNLIRDKKTNNIYNYTTQLAYVLPRNKLIYLEDKKLENKLLNTDWYPEEVNLQWSFCRYFWESHPELPDIDIDELNKICND